MSSTLRQRRTGQSNNHAISASPSAGGLASSEDDVLEMMGHQSITELPVLRQAQPDSEESASSGIQVVQEVTRIPTAQKTKEETKPSATRETTVITATTTTSTRLEEIQSTSDDIIAEVPQSTSAVASTTSISMSSLTAAARPAMSAVQVHKDEQRKKKIAVRALSGAGLIAVFTSCVYMGHLWVCGIVALSEFLLFRELVKVRYNAYFHTIQDTIPLFRTTQWTWFFVAIFYTYGDFISEVMQSNPDLHYLVTYAQYFNTLAFSLYSATFVLTIATMQAGHIKFQLNQLCWTIVVLCLTVGQMKYIMHNIFNGLFWFTFPFLLVVVNDIMAYFSGITCGRKFIHRPFIRFSPNKTWEGFIGGGIFTMIAAWYLSRFLARYPWMTCPVNEFRLVQGPLTCENHHVFMIAQSVFPNQIFEVFPKGLVKLIPGIVEICSVKRDATFANMDESIASMLGTSAPILTRCISGEESHTFHHFELVLKNVYPIQIHALWLGFFASVVAPFGGFLASAIKRAYGIKDFDSLIPGHGGVTDRLDCQFLMALCTWVHYNTFVRMATISVPKLVYFYNMLTAAEKQQFLEDIVPTAAGKEGRKQLLKRFQEYALSGTD
ncbi:phosphatidate cytidylyltransferase [Nitzschia inconspicua]|uniref:phosphatidate cytidylyltransferase n=1 Tax=Nitzschia inconspicua TaxID=303405 RepID=A0A9K3L1T3_9STRA|nr:phosphatidate cytidylyltransferase [Nitzschia inconspicua]